jgi:hypothetical protein
MVGHMERAAHPPTAERPAAARSREKLKAPPRAAMNQLSTVRKIVEEGLDTGPPSVAIELTMEQWTSLYQQWQKFSSWPMAWLSLTVNGKSVATGLATQTTELTQPCEPDATAEQRATRPTRRRKTT